MTLRALHSRRLAVWAVVTLAGALLMAAGCSDDVTDPTFPEQPQPPMGTWFLGVWGTGPDDVYIVGQPGLIYHFDGSAWSRQESGTTVPLTDVWGDGTGNVYVTGHGGTILRGSSSGGWSRMESGTSSHLFDVGRYLGDVMAVGRDGAIRMLNGSSWSAAPTEVYVRDAQQAVIDTFYIDDDEDDNYIESFASLCYYGVTGADGAILMDDPETDWQLRRVTGGREWVSCAAGNDDRVSGNFVATDGGRLFQLSFSDVDGLSWRERYSPALDATVYGIYVDQADTVWAVTNDGRINRVDPDNSFHELYEDGLVLFDIWGSSGTNLYAVGIDARVLWFHEVNPGEYGWEAIEMPDLPDPTPGKSMATHIDTAPATKFGRSLR